MWGRAWMAHQLPLAFSPMPVVLLNTYVPEGKGRVVGEKAGDRVVTLPSLGEHRLLSMRGLCLLSTRIPDTPTLSICGKMGVDILSLNR